MSQQETGLREAVTILGCIIAAIAVGPWLFMIVAAWIFEPRTGSWGAWPHVVGIGWFALVVVGVCLIFWPRFRG